MIESAWSNESEPLPETARCQTLVASQIGTAPGDLTGEARASLAKAAAKRGRILCGEMTYIGRASSIDLRDGNGLQPVANLGIELHGFSCLTESEHRTDAAAG